MACCAALALVIASALSLFRRLFGRTVVKTQFAPPARRFAPGVHVDSVVSISVPVIAATVPRFSFNTLLLMAGIGLPLLWLAAHFSSSHPAEQFTSTDYLTAAPGSVDWCRVVCSPLCPERSIE